MIEDAKEGQLLEPHEIEDLINVIKKLYGFDFSGYSKASLKRRLTRILQLKRLSFYDLKHLLINDKDFFQHFLEEVTVNVTEMFRDPLFYKAINSLVLPYLSTFQHIKIWSAGCSSGEEVYSMAILLKEAGLINKSFVYGTDINTEVLKEAKKGIYSLRNKIVRRKLSVLWFAGDHYRSFYYFV